MNIRTCYLACSLSVFVVVVIASHVWALNLTTKQYYYRCGSKLVSVGAHKVSVASSCGAPAIKEIIGFRLSWNGEREYTIEEWIYGPSRGYFTVLVFEGSTLVEIKTIKE